MKYKVGDRVRIVDHRTSGMNGAGYMDKWLGKVMTIRNVNSFCYHMEEDNDDPLRPGVGWAWYEEMVVGLAGPEDWTPEEIAYARDMVTDLACTVIYNGGDVQFCHDWEGKNNISCTIYFHTEDDHSEIEAISKPQHDDIFNPWIGKCVAICKALKEPIPDFIYKKNKG